MIHWRWAAAVRHAASQAAPRQGSTGAPESVRGYPAAIRQDETARGSVSTSCPAPETTPQVLPAWTTVSRGRVEVPDGRHNIGETPQTEIFHVLQAQEDS